MVCGLPASIKCTGSVWLTTDTTAGIDLEVIELNFELNRACSQVLIAAMQENNGTISDSACGTQYSVSMNERNQHVRIKGAARVVSMMYLDN